MDTVTGQRTKIPSGSSWAGKPDVHSGNAGCSLANFGFLQRALHAYRRSICIRVVEEIRSFPLRIQSTYLQNSTVPGRGYELPLPVEPIPYFGMLHSCNGDILRLQAQRRWMTSLDNEMAVEAWTAGLRYALDSLGTANKSSSA
jgi:hypothetical protein